MTAEVVVRFRVHVARNDKCGLRALGLFPLVIPGCAEGAGPESITTIVSIDSGLAALRRPGMTSVTFPNSTVKQRGRTHIRVPAAQNASGSRQKSRPRKRGRRECRVQAAPMARLQQGKQAGSHHRSSQYNRHSLRDGLRLIARSPRRPGFDCLRRQRTRPAGLIPASGDQDHTPSPSAAVLLVQQRPDVHRIPHSTSVTIAIRPSCGARDGGRETTYFRKTEAEYFWPEGLTRFPINPCRRANHLLAAAPQF